MLVLTSGHFPLLTPVSLSILWLPREQASSTLNTSHPVNDLLLLFHLCLKSLPVTILNLFSLVAFSVISQSSGTLNRMKDKEQLREEMKGSSGTFLIFVGNEVGEYISPQGAYALGGIINQLRNSNN